MRALTAFAGLAGLSEEIERCSHEIANRDDFNSAEYLKIMQPPDGNRGTLQDSWEDPVI